MHEIAVRLYPGMVNESYLFPSLNIVPRQFTSDLNRSTSSMLPNQEAHKDGHFLM